MAFQREILTFELLAEMMPVLKAHYNEVAHFKDIPLEVDILSYVRLEKAGHLRFFTARDTDGKMLGYANFAVKHNIHYASSLQANQDVLFLDPKARFLVGARFLIWCDVQLKAEGVQVVYHHVKHALDFSPLLVRLGYAPIETVYGRKL